ncbi:MarR family transcriptional regulator [Rhodococcus opacus]|uniref:MarR family transcriptional regulator n=1 Tax=Rhodococcus opacus TaxID=37919 RepID=A0ABT4NPK1_RHOOP|nr:MarR family transcriptional regulator [Rhodococcus opacus]MCZ4589299.1 MarR family transcriptional regulator [Rhodococcus opacus]
MTTNPDGVTAGSRAEASQPAPLHISDLLSYRLSRLANLISGSAALRYRREFDVSLAEWRTLALIGEDPSLTLNRLARRAGLDKAQMSRVVAKLTERGLLSRELGPGRTTQLSLTRKGAGVYRGLIAAANERDEAFRVCLTDEESAALESALRKLDSLARAMRRSEE